jgi:hypothetical protein
MVVLDELVRHAELAEGIAAVRLEEKAAFVAVNGRPEKLRAVELGG